MATFPPSSVQELNGATHDAPWSEQACQWFVGIDKARFHAFVVVRLPHRAIRIDWRDESRLEVEPYAEDAGELVKLGERRGFCRDCLVHMLRRYMRQYSLLMFNCRTVTYLACTEAARFSPETVYAVFDTRDMRCGLNDPAACLSLAEIHHYVAWQHLQLEKQQQQQQQEK